METAETMKPADTNETNHKNKALLWFKRIGLAGFLFFLIKGLVWLAVLFFGGKAIFD